MKKLTTQKLTKTFIQKLISYAGLMTCVAFYFLGSASFAADKSTLLVEKNREQLEQVESYLNNIRNLSAKFTQRIEDGGIAEGKFFLSRSTESAGKMRVEYSTQPKVVIVVNGSILSYFDVELDEISQLSTNTTPASLLTRPNISFSAKDVELTGVSSSADKIKISLMKKNRKEAGEFSLIFKTNPLQFVKMEVKNELGQVVEVTLSDIDFTSPIADSLFVIKKGLAESR